MRVSRGNGKVRLLDGHGKETPRATPGAGEVSECRESKIPLAIIMASVSRSES